MCGIVGYVGPRDCIDVLVSALTRLTEATILPVLLFLKMARLKLLRLKAD